MRSSNFFIRVAARLMDYMLFYLVGSFTSLFLPFEWNVTPLLLFTGLIPLLFVPIEAFFLSTWGTTPGKFLFSLGVRGANNKKLSFKNAVLAALFFKKSRAILVQGKRRWGRTVAAAILSCAAVFATYQGKPLDEYLVRFEENGVPRGWIDYHSPEGGFHVLFPTAPSVEESQFQITEGKQLNLSEHKSIHKDAGISYAVSYMELPRKWTMFSSKTLLKGAIKVIASHEKEYELVTKEITSHKNYPALDYVFRQGEKKIEGRLVLVGATIYRLSVIYPKENLPQEQQHSSFVESFELSP